jgi:hypothetical protein
MGVMRKRRRGVGFGHRHPTLVAGIGTTPLSDKVTRLSAVGTDTSHDARETLPRAITRVSWQTSAPEQVNRDIVMVDGAITRATLQLPGR